MSMPTSICTVVEGSAACDLLQADKLGGCWAGCERSCFVLNHLPTCLLSPSMPPPGAGPCLILPGGRHVNAMYKQSLQAMHRAGASGAPACCKDANARDSSLAGEMRQGMLGQDHELTDQSTDAFMHCSLHGRGCCAMLPEGSQADLDHLGVQLGHSSSHCCLVTKSTSSVSFDKQHHASSRRCSAISML